LIYFDTAYLAKCYLAEPGYKIVRGLADESGAIACSDLGRAELAAVFHRHYREKRLDADAYTVVRRQFHQDLRDGIWHWLPVDTRVWEAVDARYADLPPDVFLRGADAIHLVSAHIHGIREVYSSDRHLLAACSTFGLEGCNPIAGG